MSLPGAIITHLSRNSGSAGPRTAFGHRFNVLVHDFLPRHCVRTGDSWLKQAGNPRVFAQRILVVAGTPPAALPVTGVAVPKNPATMVRTASCVEKNVHSTTPDVGRGSTIGRKRTGCDWPIG